MAVVSFSDSSDRTFLFKALIRIYHPAFPEQRGCAALVNVEKKQAFT